MIDDAFDPEKFRRLGHAAVDQLADAMGEARRAEVPVRLAQSPQEAFEMWQTQEECDLVGETIAHSFRVHHPGNLGHQVGPVLPEVAVMDLVGSLLDTGNGIFEVGNPATPMERVVVKDLAERFGLPSDADGILTSGGSLGNLTALLAMRQSVTGSWNSGTGDSRFAVLVSEEAHYCVSRSAKIMGWGTEGVIPVAVDSEFRMRPDAAAEALKVAKLRGLQVIGMVGSAGATATGRIDPLHELAEFCEKNALWFHVDAAHAGAFIFSEKARGLLSGIERADSIVLDFHKMLLSSGLLTAVLFRRAEDSFQTFAQKADYLWSQDDSQEWWDLAKRTLECTRPMLGLRAFTALRAGKEGLFEEYIDRALELTHQFASLIEEAPDFELLVEPESNILCYRYVPDDRDKKALNEPNEKIRLELIETGEFYIVQVEKNERVYLRSALMNPFMTTESFTALLEKIRSL